jgi:hypothetical protein
MQNQTSPNNSVDRSATRVTLVEGFVDATEYRNRFKQ